MSNTVKLQTTTMPFLCYVTLCCSTMNCRISFLILSVLLVGFTMVLYNSGWLNVPLDKKPEMLSYWAAMEPINKGEWKPGLRYKPDLKCQGTKARKLHFVFKNKDLSNPNILHSFKNKIIDKNVTMFGDSLQLELFKSMAVILKTYGSRTAKRIQHKHYRYYRMHACTSEMKKLNLRAVFFYEYNSFLCKHKHTGKIRDQQKNDCRRNPEQ